MSRLHTRPTKRQTLLAELRLDEPPISSIKMINMPTRDLLVPYIKHFQITVGTWASITMFVVKQTAPPANAEIFYIHRG